MDFTKVWSSLSEGQGTVIASIVTMTAAIGGVLLGTFLFGNRVRSLRQALTRSENLLQEHLKNVEEKLAEHLLQIDADFENRFGGIDATLVDVASAQVGDIKTYWQIVRDRIEDKISSIQDGRRRAKFNRIDRRNYPALVEKLAEDGLLQRPDLYAQAAALWSRYRNGKAKPSADEIAKMKEISELVSS